MTDPTDLDADTLPAPYVTLIDNGTADAFVAVVVPVPDVDDGDDFTRAADILDDLATRPAVHPDAWCPRCGRPDALHVDPGEVGSCAGMAKAAVDAFHFAPLDEWTAARNAFLGLFGYELGDRATFGTRVVNVVGANLSARTAVVQYERNPFTFEVGFGALEPIDVDVATKAGEVLDALTAA